MMTMMMMTMMMVMMKMMMMRVFSVEIPSVPVERYQHFGATCYLQIHSSISRVRVAGSFEILIP